jgi:L-asparagine transporter-like permease
MIISNCIRHLFPKIKWWTPNAITGIAATAFIIFISNGVTRFSFMSSEFWVAVTYILLVVVLPVISLLSILKKKRGEKLA